jgi:hypothetical protein
MDALYILNVKTKEILLSKEYSDKDNKTKLQIFLSEINNILKEEISPIINIDNGIFIYKVLSSSQNSKEDSNLMLVSLLSEDVNR